jgi:predicted metalloprotease with PDZ domain
MCLPAAGSSTAQLEIDATQLNRKLLTATQEIQLSGSLARSGGPLALWYPKWVPGVHGPNGPVANLAGLLVEDPSGRTLTWRRTPGEVHRIEVDVPAGTSRLRLRSRYITNQPTTNSRGIDSFGADGIGVINPNTVLFYPEDQPPGKTPIEVTLDLPAGWTAASSLRATTTDDGRVSYRAVSIEELVDSPILLGRHSRSYDLITDEAPAHTPPHILHVLSETQKGVEVDSAVIEGYQRVVAEASALFGSHPFESFDILLGSTDALRANGLEHSRSSFNVLAIEPLTDPKGLDGWNRMLVPHEYVHAWCGKYRRPAGMVTGDFHTPMDTRLLWVYEGLTQYLGSLLEVRSGLMTADEYLYGLNRSLGSALHQQGRQWRSLEDTANAAHSLRGHSSSWGHLRRGQDYYGEGALVWMEIDARLRNLSSGEKSLDNFVREFFVYEPGMDHPRGFDRSEILAILDRLAPGQNWTEFLHRRIDLTQERFGLGLLEELGYHVQYGNEPPELPEGVKAPSGQTISALESLGLRADKEGEIREVLLDSPADRAGLGPGMKIAGVGDYVWSKIRFEEALADTVVNPNLDLLVVSGDRFVHYTIEYNQGPRHRLLVRDDDKPDRLAQIVASRLR